MGGGQNQPASNPYMPTAQTGPTSTPQGYGLNRYGAQNVGYRPAQYTPQNFQAQPLDIMGMLTQIRAQNAAPQNRWGSLIGSRGQQPGQPRTSGGPVTGYSPANDGMGGGDPYSGY